MQLILVLRTQVNDARKYTGCEVQAVREIEKWEEERNEEV